MVRTNDSSTLDTNNRLFNVGDVAKHLAVSRSKVYKLMDDGLLRFVKLGKSRRVRWCDVQELIDKSIVNNDD
jgi:excisionase family DNA binding protein